MPNNLPINQGSADGSGYSSQFAPTSMHSLAGNDPPHFSQTVELGGEGNLSSTARAQVSTMRLHGGLRAYGEVLQATCAPDGQVNSPPSHPAPSRQAPSPAHSWGRNVPFYSASRVFHVTLCFFCFWLYARICMPLIWALNLIIVYFGTTGWFR